MSRDVRAEDLADARLLLRDGRRLGYRIYGLPGGRPLVFFHGFPGSRLQAALVHAQALAAGIALVAFDRPGFGLSDPGRALHVDRIAGDVSELADALGHRRFAVLGVSCGGPHALATAKLLRDRVVGVGLLAGMGPMDRPEVRGGQMPLLATMFRLARINAWLVAPVLALDRAMLRVNAERAVNALASMLSPPDRAMLERPATKAAFGISLADAYRQGIGGAMQEAHRIARFTAADLGPVSVPVHVFQSGQDRHVPPEMGRFIARVLPTAVYHDCPDEGHLSIVVNRFDECARLALRAL